MTLADAQRWLNQTHVGDCRQLNRTYVDPQPLP